MAMSETILFLAHVDEDGGLPRAALEALGVATDVVSGMPGAVLHAGLVGADVRAAAATMAGAGCARVLAVTGAAFGQARYATDAAAAEAICRASGAGLVIAAGTSRWTRALPGVAERLGGRADTHVTATAAAKGGLSITRWFYRQRIEGTFHRSARPWVVLSDPGCCAPWDGDGVAVATCAAEILDVPLDAAQLRTRVVGLEVPPSAVQTIRPDAPLLFVAGAGWMKKQADGQTHAAEAGETILEFLGRAHASLGGTKSVVDLGGEGHAVLPFMSHLNQVGQTGSTPRHPKGLATCCHGEEPHVVGWRFVAERRAVNLDPNCGWARGKADVLYVADAFEVMRNVNEQLDKGPR
jgi:electron transfer flavoprotein alpha subunit